MHARKSSLGHLLVSAAALVQAVAQCSLAVHEESQALPHLRLHPEGLCEARLQTSGAPLQLPPVKAEKNKNGGDVMRSEQ